MIITPVRTRVFSDREKLAPFIVNNVRHLPEGAVLVVTSKIVALSEGRTVFVTNGRDKDTLVRSESDWAVRTKYVWLTLRNGLISANAGIDESNANGKLILLPRNSFTAAADLRTILRRRYKVRRLGVLIVDSRTMPLRAGVTGVALGYAGFRGLRDYRGLPDIFGRRLHFSRTNVADCLASAAVLTMGEGDEQQPLAIIKNAPVEFYERVNHKELLIPPKDDMYSPVLRWPQI